MFANMKLGTKISLGFAVLLVLTVAVGAAAITSMWGVTAKANSLVNREMPQVDICNDIDTAIRDANLAARAYAYSGEKRHFDEAQKNFEAADTHFQEADTFIKAHPELTKFKDQKEQLIKAVASFKSEISGTFENWKAVEENQNKMLDERKKFLAVTSEYLGLQYKKSDQDIRNKAEEAVLLHRVEKISKMESLVDDINESMQSVLLAVGDHNPDALNNAKAQYETLIKKLGGLRAITTQDDDLKRMTALEDAGTQFRDSSLAMQQALREMVGNAKRRTDKVAACMAIDNAMLNEAIDTAVTNSKESATSLTNASTTVMIGLGIAFFVGVALAFFITRGINKALNRIIHGLSSSSEQVSAASGQVAQSSQQLAEGASEQASSLEETSASLEEMASMTRQNADNAKQANQMALQARDGADQGRQAMTRMIDAIGHIKKSSDETAKIVKTIDEIAFQTNLLALNAAVEAARAGEAGKGFAVVAEEVRNLAMRSAEAAKNTAALIEQSQKNSENGVNVSSEVAQILQKIVDVAQKLTQLSGEVSAASNEQSKGIEQVNAAVSQMDKVTQSNAASAEESASASEELSAQARELQDMVGALVNLVGSSNGTAHTAPATAPAARTNTLSFKPSSVGKHTLVRATANHSTENAKEHGNGNGNGSGHNRIQKHVGASAAPESVIPLTADELKEF